MYNKEHSKLGAYRVRPVKLVSNAYNHVWNEKLCDLEADMGISTTKPFDCGILRERV